MAHFQEITKSSLMHFQKEKDIDNLTTNLNTKLLPTHMKSGESGEQFIFKLRGIPRAAFKNTKPSENTSNWRKKEKMHPNLVVFSSF